MCAFKSNCEQNAQARRDEWKWLREILSSFHTLSTYKTDKYQNETCRQNCGTSINAREKRSLASTKSATQSNTKKMCFFWLFCLCTMSSEVCSVFLPLAKCCNFDKSNQIFLGIHFSDDLSILSVGFYSCRLIISGNISLVQLVFFCASSLQLDKSNKRNGKRRHG